MSTSIIYSYWYYSILLHFTFFWYFSSTILFYFTSLLWHTPSLFMIGRRPMSLSLENPDDSDVDIGRNSFQMQKIRRAFEHGQQVHGQPVGQSCVVLCCVVLCCVVLCCVVLYCIVLYWVSSITLWIKNKGRANFSMTISLTIFLPYPSCLSLPA